MEGVCGPSIQLPCKHFAWLLGLLDGKGAGGEVRAAGQVGYLLLDLFHGWLGWQHHSPWGLSIVSNWYTTGEGPGNTCALSVGIVV